MICHRCVQRIRSLKPATTSAVIVQSCRREASALSPLRPSIYELSRASTASRSITTTPSPSTSQLSSSNTTSSEPISSVRAGTPLKGLGYFKGKDPPVALEDHEYPDWLWGLLGKSDGAKSNGEEIGDTYSKSKKTRHKARLALKAAKTNPEALKPKIPIEQQSIDLPVGDGTFKGAIEAAQEREKVTEAMRKGRRKSIKEKNFLKTMR